MEILIVVGIAWVALILALVALRNLLIVVPPNKVLVISGRGHRTPEGDTVGYRVIRGGRAFRVPLLEKVSWMDLTTIALDLRSESAYSKGGIPLTIHAVANVKIHADAPYLNNAIERFLEMPRDAAPTSITSIVKDTLEGNLRGVVAELTPEEINEDRLKFAQTLINEAEHDLNNLGIKLDTLKIQNVSDASGYLDSIGRRKTAEVLKEARVAEAQREAEASEEEARAKQRSEIAKVQAEQAILEERNKFTIRQSELSVDAELAKVRAQQQYDREQALLRAALREKQAEADRMARVSEAEQVAQASEAEALGRQRAEVAQVAARQRIVEQENLLRVRTAELDAVALAREAEAQIAGEQARVRAQQELEAQRVILNAKKYEADIVAPARAQMEAERLAAMGAAAPIIEEGKAKAEAAALLLQAFNQPGGRDAFVLNMLPVVLKEFADSVKGMRIDKLTVIDSGTGSAHRQMVQALPANIIGLVEQLETATGVNLLSALQSRVAGPADLPELQPTSND